MFAASNSIHSKVTFWHLGRLMERYHHPMIDLSENVHNSNVIPLDLCLGSHKSKQAIHPGNPFTKVRRNHELVME
jgi:hypothetical protein